MGGIIQCFYYTKKKYCIVHRKTIRCFFFDMIKKILYCFTTNNIIFFFVKNILYDAGWRVKCCARRIEKNAVEN
jgi:hypothetical protein